jgi:hypothetical protein
VGDLPWVRACKPELTVLQMELPTLDLRNLSAGTIPRISRGMASALAEAAGVCLTEAGHKTGVTMRVYADSVSGCRIEWDPASSDSHRFWRDEDEATEYGACGVAVLLIREATELTVIERCRKGPGFDYWLGSEEDDLFEHKARLEVSGLRKADESAVRARVRRKAKQISVSDGALPGYVVIVEFGQPTSHVHVR